MADHRHSSKRNYDGPSPPPRRNPLVDRPPPALTPAGGAPALSSSPKMPPPASTPAGGAPALSSSPNMPPPASPSSHGVLVRRPFDELQAAKQRAQKVADMLLMAAGVNSPHVDKDVVGAGGSPGDSDRTGGGGLVFSSSAGDVDAHISSNDNLNERTLYKDGLMKQIAVSHDSSQHGNFPAHREANSGTTDSYLGMAKSWDQPSAGSFPGYYQPRWDQFSNQQNSWNQNYNYSAYQNQWQQPFSQSRHTSTYPSEPGSSATEQFSNQQNCGNQYYNYSAYQNQWQTQLSQSHHNSETSRYASEQGYSATESLYVAPDTYAGYDIQPQPHIGYGQSNYGYEHQNYIQPAYGVAPPHSETYPDSNLPATYMSWQTEMAPVFIEQSVCASVSSVAPPAPESSDVYKIDAERLRNAMSAPSCKKIGQGGFGQVYKVCIDGKDVAVKLLNEDETVFLTSKERRLMARQFNSEVKVLSEVKHQNLVQLISACEDRWAIVYEYMPNGNLYDKITALGKNFKWSDRVQVAVDICNALIYLHNRPKPIVHGDISPTNVLFDSRNAAKLADFGLSRILEHFSKTGTLMHGTENTPLGTVGFMDPVYKDTGELTVSSDTYSFGVILLTLVTGECVNSALRHQVHTTLETGPFWDLSQCNLKATRRAFKAVNLVERHLSIPKNNLLDALEMLKLGLRCSGRARRKRPNLTTKVLPALLSIRDAIQVKPKDI